MSNTYAFCVGQQAQLCSDCFFWLSSLCGAVSRGDKNSPTKHQTQNTQTHTHSTNTHMQAQTPECTAKWRPSQPLDQRECLYQLRWSRPIDRGPVPWLVYFQTAEFPLRTFSITLLICLSTLKCWTQWYIWCTCLQNRKILQPVSPPAVNTQSGRKRWLKAEITLWISMH